MKEKKCLLASIFFMVYLPSAMAQNGLTVYGMPSGYTLNQVRYKNCITTDVNNNVYVGFRDIGLGKFTPSTSTWVMYDTVNSVIPSNKILSLDIDNAGNVWAGTTKGLAKYDGSNWTVYNTQNSNLINDSVQSLFIVGTNIWLGTPQGVSVFNGSFTNYTTSNSSLVNNNITCFDVDSAGKILIGTTGGISIFDGSTWTNYTTANSGLISNQIRQVKYVSSKATWISTVAGICKLQNGTIINYNCDYTYLFNFFMASYTIAKKSDELYVFQYNLTRFNEDDNIDSIGVNVRAMGSVALIQFTHFAFDHNGLLWTAYGANSTTAGLSAFDETQSSGFVNVTHVSSEKHIDINNVGALIRNRGEMFWDGVGAPQYEVPKCSGKHANFAAALWIGGYDQNGLLHTAAQTYRQGGRNDFLPGPLDTTNATMDSLITMAPYDNIWRTNRNTIDAFKINFLNGNVTNGTYPVPNEILSYPANGSGNITRNLAPYVDYNGDGNYNPYDGDYPKIKGDQQLYWIFNDQTLHTETGGPAFGFEIHAYAYAYSCNQINLGDSNAVIDYTTFYKYEIINRSINTYDSVFIGLMTDSDLGDGWDDYLGCDSVLNAAFTYNGDNDDGTGFPNGYGLNPPMINCQVLKGPEPVPNDGIDNDHDGIIDESGELNMMTVFHPYTGGGSITGYPVATDDYYQFLISRWRDGSFVTNDGLNGTNQNSPPTNYLYSGVPYSGNGWTEGSAGNVPSDRRFVLSSGPFTIAPNETRTIDFAYVFTWDSTAVNGLNTSIARNTADLQRVKYWFDNNNFPSCLNTGIEHASTKIPEIKIFPNPSTDFITVRCSDVSSPVKVDMYDVTGRKILSRKIISEGQVNVSRLSPSVYFLRAVVNGNAVTKKFVKN